mgnify:CR=1 FL=1
MSHARHDGQSGAQIVPGAQQIQAVDRATPQVAEDGRRVHRPSQEAQPIEFYCFSDV